jgi:DNA repair exonuclease SbcCD nuclease subunit
VAVIGRNFTFVHAADLHLDTAFQGIGEVAPFVAAALREASLDAFDDIVELAIRSRAAFVLVAGDVYDGPERGLRAQLRFRDGLIRLADHAIATFVVHGNHDPVATGWSAIGSTWPDLVTIFAPGTATVVPVLVDGEQIATVQGISYATAATTENLALGLSRPSGPGPHIGLLHCNVEGASDAHANYSPCTLADLRRTGLDYLALGHVHERRVLTDGRGGDPWIVYPGNTQARSPRATERGPKGALLVQVTDGAVEGVEFVACDRVRFEEVACDIGDLEDLGELCDRLAELAAERLASADGRSIVLRARLIGRGPLHPDLARTKVTDELLTELRAATAERTPFCWWDRLIDETALGFDLAELRGRGDFASDLLAGAERLATDDATLSRLVAQLHAEAPRPLAGRLEELARDTDGLRTLFDHAVMRALDELALEDL